MLLKQAPRISVEELIRSGNLRSGELNMPFYLARFAQEINRPRRRNRRLGVVGNIEAINPSTTTSIAMAWSAARSTGLPSAISVSGPTNGTTTVRQPVTYTYGSSGASAINQIAQTTTTIATSGTLNFNMVTWAYNVIGDASATFSAIKEWWVELLTVAQGGGAAASDILMGNHATNAWAAILDATGTYALASGGLWHHQDQSSAGLAVSAGDLLKTVNGDASNIATVRFTAFGFK